MSAFIEPLYTLTSRAFAACYGAADFSDRSGSRRSTMHKIKNWAQREGYNPAFTICGTKSASFNRCNYL